MVFLDGRAAAPTSSTKSSSYGYADKVICCVSVKSSFGGDSRSSGCDVDGVIL
jgi:hypothetical protein